MIRRIYVVILTIGLMTACKQENKVAGDVGLQFYSLRHQFENDVPGTLDLINQWGIELIEGGETYGMERDDFLELLKQKGFRVVSIGADYNDLAGSPDQIIEKAKAYGAKYVMIPWIPHDGDNFTFEDTERAVTLFNQAGEELSRAGLSLVYHPHGYEFRPHGEGNLMDYMLDNAEHFDFEMDVYWFQHGGADPMAYLNEYPDQFKLMHIKDMAKGVKGNYSGHEDIETSVTLGTGQIDIAGLVKRARELGIEYMFIEDESSRVVEQVPQSLEFLNALP